MHMTICLCVNIPTVPEAGSSALRTFYVGPNWTFTQLKEQIRWARKTAACAAESTGRNRDK